MNPGEVLYVTNNAPYIRRLEFGFQGKYDNASHHADDGRGRYYIGFGPKSVNGRSSQAPDGFIRVAAAAIQPIVDEVAASLSSE